MAVVHPLMAGPVRLLVSLRVNPLSIVALHGACAAAAALLIATGPRGWPPAAVLLLVRMLLDNIDGAVARASGQVTEAGRYADTGLDFVTNLLLFLALGTMTGQLPALAAFVLLMLLLSYDHCLEVSYMNLRAAPGSAAVPAEGPRFVLVPFRWLYRLVLAPQDRLFRRLELSRFERLAGRPFASAPRGWQLAWFDRFAGSLVVNVGLSTQSTVLALLLLFGAPQAYVPLVFLQVLTMLLLQVWRSRRFRNYVQLAVPGAS